MSGAVAWRRVSRIAHPLNAKLPLISNASAFILPDLSQEARHRSTCPPRSRLRPGTASMQDVSHHTALMSWRDGETEENTHWYSYSCAFATGRFMKISSPWPSSCSLADFDITAPRRIELDDRDRYADICVPCKNREKSGRDE